MIAGLAEQLEGYGIYVKVDRGTQRGACPKCGRGARDDTLSVTIDDGARWNCFRCGFKGGIGRSNGARHHPGVKRDQHERVALEAAEKLKAGHYVGGAHPYLKRKGISTHGLKADSSNRLLVPMYDVEGKIWNLQTIAHNGDKRFLKGGRVKGCFFVLGNDKGDTFEQLVIAEGFATAASIRQAVNTVPVVIAFNRTNLAPVARALRAAYPEACAVIAADDDHATEGNPGLTDARAAAELVGAAVAVPEFPANGGSRGTDFNDLHVGHGLEAVSKIIQAALDSEPEPRQPPPEPEQQAPRVLNLDDYRATRFIGEPPPIHWLVQHSIPLGVAVLLAAMGGVGKSYLILQLCYLVATRSSEENPGTDEQIHNLNTFTRPILGGAVVKHGKVVFITAEDNDDSLHRRLNAIDPHGRRTDDLIIVGLPSAGGPMPFFTMDHNGVRTTDAWSMIRNQLLNMEGLVLIAVDPLAAFAQVPLDADSAASQFVMSAFGQLAAETGATVILSHHMRKATNGKAPQTPAEARDAIRGSTAIVDGVRLAYALWPVDEDEGRKICTKLEMLPCDPNRVVKGAIVKTNEKGGKVSTYVRTDIGLLIDRTADLNTGPNRDELLGLLEADLAACAEDLMPLEKTGASGVHEQRECLHPDLRRLPRDYLRALCQNLLDSGRITKCRAKGSTTAKWLDAPGGPFTRTNGDGEIRTGTRTKRHPE